MSLTVNVDTYNADGYSTNAVSYLGPDNTISVKDQIVLRRTAPKPTPTFSGLSRTSAKLTRTLALTNALTDTGDLIIEITVAAPVGVATADIDSALNDMGAFLSSATFKTHVKTPQVAF